MSAHLLRHVDEYLAVAQEAGASDVHLGVNAPPVWRLHGTLQPIWPDAPRFKAEQTQKLADTFLNDVQRVLVKERGDADFAYANSRGRYRASVSGRTSFFASSIPAFARWTSSVCRNT